MVAPHVVMRTLSLALLFLGVSGHVTNAAVPRTPEAARQQTVHYRLEHLHPDSASLAITMVLPEAQSGVVDIAMPRAIPMGYGTQPYDRFVHDLIATNAAGERLAVVDLDGPRWRVNAVTPVVQISYRVNVARMEREILNAGDASRLRRDYAGLLGYSIFAFIDAFTEHPVALTVRMPNAWPIHTTLAHSGGTGELTARARNFYALADAQIMAGPAMTIRTPPSAIPFALVLYAEQPVATDTLAALASRALQASAEYFGMSPVTRYTAAIEVLTPISPQHDYRFSMEHLESATYRYAVGQVDMSPGGRERTYYNLLHHTVHSWLPKQCAPSGYYPHVWDYAAAIDGIWFSEGWAQFIAADIFAGRGPDADARRRGRVALRFDGPAAERAAPFAGQSTEALSRVAAHQYSDDFRLSALVFSRGGKMAAAIDERVRTQTKGAKAFRDVARALMQWCASATTPVTASVLATVTQRATGVQVQDIIATWLAAQGPTVPSRPRP